MKKKRNPRSEASQREAIALLKKNTTKKCYVFVEPQDNAESYIVKVLDNYTYEVIAEFDLRDCYKLRAPLKGFKKAISKAIRPRRKKK